MCALASGTISPLPRAVLPSGLDPSPPCAIVDHSWVPLSACQIDRLPVIRSWWLALAQPLPGELGEDGRPSHAQCRRRNPDLIAERCQPIPTLGIEVSDDRAPL